MQQTPRRRSNSLPIPKIEVSIYQSPENKKKENGRESDGQDPQECPLSGDYALKCLMFTKIMLFSEKVFNLFILVRL